MEIDRLKREDVTSSELTQAKDFCRGQLQLGLEGTSSYMQWLGEHELSLSKVPTPEEVMAGIDAVTCGDIRRVAGNMFVNENLCLAAIGPIKNEKELTERFRL